MGVCGGNDDNVSDEVFPEKRDMGRQVLTRLYLKSCGILCDAAMRLKFPQFILPSV